MWYKPFVVVIICCFCIIGGWSIATPTLASSGWLIYYESFFSGKVIDADTKEPIEGVVVVAVYNVRLFGPILPIFSGAHTADVQEARTDRKGEFFIPSNIFFYPLPTTLGGDNTEFIIYKPGYESYPKNYSFFIYPVKETLKVMKKGTTEVRDMEGIVFKKRLTNKEDRDMYVEKFRVNNSPFIPLKNPFKRVRSLELPFDADVINAEPLWTVHRKPFKTYPVIGLSKLNTMEERRKASMVGVTGYGSKDLPLLYKALNEEERYLGMPERE